ncbi:hypothetical protein E2C01_007279 [Portunus trituberculatus]|uniref:Uncharacterized protein n=1 Tax=Portunus trituberculatus TaxID=210409 RepID=A0A5B7CXR5_PORTR|nr:hypothetical protein [Portunus trituberculatus]
MLVEGRREGGLGVNTHPHNINLASLVEVGVGERVKHIIGRLLLDLLLDGDAPEGRQLEGQVLVAAGVVVDSLHLYGIVIPPLLCLLVEELGEGVMAGGTDAQCGV